jgi:hypothetical protein
MLVKLCAARSGAILADRDYSLSILNGDDDNIVKSAFDEYLYCREPFLPDWLSCPRSFNLELARLSCRLTWPDQPTVCFQRNLDIAKVLNLFLDGQEY